MTSVLNFQLCQVAHALDKERPTLEVHPNAKDHSIDSNKSLINPTTNQTCVGDEYALKSASKIFKILFFCRRPTCT